MPGPPPPPPPGAPPPPMMAPPPPVKGGADDRGALLKSIRQGTKLKKTVTVDKSAPLIPGKISNNNASVSSVGNNTGTPSNGVGLGGLFAGGMPKLRPTGKLGASNLHSPSNNNSNLMKKNEATTPTKNINIQNELKKQLAIDSRNRGPPPPAPIRQIPEPISTKQYHSNGVTTPTAAPPPLQINHSTLHRKTKSNANLSSLDSPDNVNNSYMHTTKPVINHGKPNLAPKPPVLNGKPMSLPKKPTMNGKTISRAQSMKSPRSPSPQSPDGGGNAVQIKFGTVRNMSSMLAQNFANSTGNLTTRSRPALNGRPTAPPPSIPPPPPSFFKENPAPAPPINAMMPLTPKLSLVKPPNHAPPPPPNSSLPQPPNHPPPLPPHRTPAALRTPPAIPNNTSAPPPPPRNSSMRETTTTTTQATTTATPKRISIDLEQKYKDYFQKPDTFPKPPLYKNVTKVYSNRQGY